jgi:hypothetical protein
VAKTGSVAARKTIEFLNSRGISDQKPGLAAAIVDMAEESGVALARIPAASILNQNISVDLSERGQAVTYPVVLVYVDRVRNVLTEKFRTFSGKVRTVAEIRVSQDRLEALEERLRLYVDAVTQVLDANRGSWGEGVFFAGAYEVGIDAVKHGGKNFLQIAKVVFEVDLSK